jgi:WD40 repeat protein
MLQAPSAVSALALSANGQYVAAATRGAEVVLWSGRERTQRVLRGHVRTVAALAFSPDGTWLASSAPGGRLWVWNIERQGAGRALSDSVEAAGDLAI